MQTMARQIHDDESLINAEPTVAPLHEVFRLQGDEELEAAEKRYLPARAAPLSAIVLAAGAGAMGVRLGMPVHEVDGMQPRPELGVGEPAEGPFLDSTVGLLWRAVVVWVFALVLLTVARLL
jgi:cobalamin biosynthesis protein CobD/CbiB